MITGKTPRQQKDGKIDSENPKTSEADSVVKGKPPQSSNKGKAMTNRTGGRGKKEKQPKPNITKPTPRKIQVGGKMKGGVKAVKSSGDFLGRLGTLVVMLVTLMSTSVVMVSSFVEGVYWKGALFAALLLFIHLPVTVAMIWIMCKARVQSLYKKVRPVKTVEGGTVVVVEETVAEEADDTEVIEAEVPDQVTTNGGAPNGTLTYRGSHNAGFEGGT